MKECSLLPPDEIKKIVAHASLSHDKVAAFLRQVRIDPRMGARALELMLLVPMRNAVVKAKWGEFDLTGRNTVEKIPTWTIPKERVKGRNVLREKHRVPLSSSVLAMLLAIKTENAGPDNWVFPQYKTGWTKPRAIDSNTPTRSSRALIRPLRCTALEAPLGIGATRRSTPTRQGSRTLNHGSNMRLRRLVWRTRSGTKLFVHTPAATC